MTFQIRRVVSGPLERDRQSDWLFEVRDMNRPSGLAAVYFLGRRDELIGLSIPAVFQGTIATLETLTPRTVDALGTTVASYTSEVRHGEPKPGNTLWLFYLSESVRIPYVDAMEVKERPGLDTILAPMFMTRNGAFLLVRTSPS
jgi:hypothetical protein